MAHHHRPKSSDIRGWTHCVTPDECAARPERGRAHGNIIRVDICSCGATRESEINGGRVNYGAWDDESSLKIGEKR